MIALKVLNSLSYSETGFPEQFNGTIEAKENENQVADGSFLLLMTT